MNGEQMNEIKVGDIFFTKQTLSGRHGWVVLEISKIFKSRLDYPDKGPFYYWKILDCEDKNYYKSEIDGIDNANFEAADLKKWNAVKLSKKNWRKELLACLI